MFCTQVSLLQRTHARAYCHNICVNSCHVKGKGTCFINLDGGVCHPPSATTLKTLYPHARTARLFWPPLFRGLVYLQFLATLELGGSKQAISRDNQAILSLSLSRDSHTWVQ